MSNVTLEIGGRAYKVACATGEEEHVAELGRMIDARVKSLPAQSESRTLLFAALLLADEIYDLKAKAASASETNAAEFAEPLEKLAERLESLASHLEDGAEHPK